MQTFCTITTAAYFPVARALYSSLQQQDPGSMLHVLIVDGNSFSSENNLRLLSLNDISGTNLFKNIETKYAHASMDSFRWALKPLLVGYLLENNYEKVIFTDPDQYFTGRFDFLFDLLDKHGLLLTPHWPDPDVSTNPDSVLSVMKGGLFNAGFVGASRKGLPAINWWAALCYYKMEKRPDLGVYDDQKYLDLLPVEFENVHILRHQGCNLASWNIQACKREIINHQLRINRIFEPVFIHFANNTIRNILNRNDALLKPYLDEYIAKLKEQGYDLLKNINEHFPSGYNTLFYKTKHRLRLRTRLKRFLYRLAEKL